MGYYSLPQKVNRYEISQCTKQEIIIIIIIIKCKKLSCLVHSIARMFTPRGGGGGYSHTLPLRVCAAQRGCDSEAPDFLERGIIFRTHKSSTFVSSHLKLFKDRLLLKIPFNELTSKPLYSCCTLERSIKNWPISRTGYQFQGEFYNGV